MRKLLGRPSRVSLVGSCLLFFAYQASGARRGSELLPDVTSGHRTKIAPADVAHVVAGRLGLMLPGTPHDAPAAAWFWIKNTCVKQAGIQAAPLPPVVAVVAM